LVLPNDNLTKLVERIEDYWDDKERHPKEGCTHVIINSPYLILKREIQIKDSEIDELREKVERLSLQRQEPNILKRVYLRGEIKEGNEVKYGNDHICFLSMT
ncbi:9057_t:CDS:2, partial [Racocetra fulgida]